MKATEFLAMAGAVALGVAAGVIVANQVQKALKLV